MSYRENITRIKAVYLALEELASEVVFVGGATVSLYSTRPETATRPTDDVDIVVEIMHYKDYAAIEAKLRSKGFINDIQSGVICRYIINGITVDVMPTSEEILGFSNKWYSEAFVNRGENEGRFSPDFEDIVHVLNNRQPVWEEIRRANEPVKQYLNNEFQKLLSQKYIDEWIGAHLEYNEQRRVGFILGSMSEFVEETI
jgi:hypothetical protein